jgi:diguanylate cyclase (GGDEF)-like protein
MSTAGARDRSRTTPGAPRGGKTASPDDAEATADAMPAIVIAGPTVDSLPTIASTSEAVAGEDLFHRRTTSVTKPAKKKSRRRACLLVLCGPQEGQIFRLKTGVTVTIGRAPEAEVCLDDEGISRQHARVIVREEGDVILEDQGSRNGTFVGDNQITRQVLASEDVIRVGGATVLKFSWVDSAEEEHRMRLLAAALRDPLTGVYNRRHFDECLMAESAAARRHTKPVCLILLDLDGFKGINDLHGHPAGDAVLRGVSRALQSCARREDLVFRYGGEEFAVIARDTHIAGALQFGERLRRRVERVRVKTGDTPNLQITLSAGVAQLEAAESDVEWVARADAALYRAKRAGKNRVEPG